MDPRRQEALRAANEGRHADAAQLFGDLVKDHPKDAELLLLYGAELVRAGKLAPGSRALARAAELDPENARVWSSLAVARAEQNQLLAAYRAAQRALALDPNDAQAQAVMERAEGVPMGAASLTEREPLWTAIGVTLLLLGCVLTGLIVAFPPVTMPTGGADSLAETRLLPDARSQAIVLAFLFVAVATFLWLVFDVLQRRSRLVWIVPYAVCCACGVPWAPVALYLFAGRAPVKSGT